jgi:cytoskeletal protein RodZ
MSEEYDNESSTTFSPFYPLLILLVGLILWSGYQVFMANSQRSANAAQIQAAMPSITQAQNVKDRYVSLMKDLIETASKDPQAAQIVKEATAAGLLRVQQPAPGDAGTSTNGAAAAAPAPTDGSAPASK